MHWKQIWWIIPISFIGILYYLSDNDLNSELGSRREFSNLQKVVNKDKNCEHIQSWEVLPTQYFICRKTYALSMNPESKMADWVSYCANQSNLINDGVEQNRNWKKDPDLPETVQLEPEDYKNVSKAGYDRGHQAPLATFKGKNWQETNYTSNITPQKIALNRGAWLQLEDYERSLIQKYGRICTITGPYYQHETNVKSLVNANESYIIPSGYWKIIRYNNKIEGYLYSQNTPSDADFKLGAIPINEIENFAGFKIY